MTRDKYSIKGDNNVMIVRSKVTNAFNKVKGDFEADTENFLREVGEIVSDSEDNEAAEHYEGMLESLKKGSTSMAHSLWKGLVNILPDVAKVSGAAAAIVKLFGA